MLGLWSGCGCGQVVVVVRLWLWSGCVKAVLRLYCVNVVLCLFCSHGGCSINVD